MTAADRADLRAEIAATLQAEADEAIVQARAAAYRRSPFWPFGQLTPAQQRARAAQEEAMRCGVLRRAPEALL